MRRLSRRLQLLAHALLTSSCLPHLSPRRSQLLLELSHPSAQREVGVLDIGKVARGFASSQVLSTGGDASGKTLQSYRCIQVRVVTVGVHRSMRVKQEQSTHAAR